MENFIVYGPGRTGTTTLVHLIDIHPESGVIECELWSDRTKSNFKEFKKEFASACEQFDGHKILVGQLNEQMREYALSSECKVILTSRRNVLKAAVSRMIARQTGRWTIQQKSVEPEVYEPLVLTEVAKYMNIQKRVVWAREVLMRAHKTPFEVVYEDFYLAVLELKIETLKRMFVFLGLSPTVTKEMVGVLERGPIINQRHYLKIPNIYEIEKGLGSDEKGWLFDGYGGLV